MALVMGPSQWPCIFRVRSALGNSFAILAPDIRVNAQAKLVRPIITGVNSTWQKCYLNAYFWVYWGRYGPWNYGVSSLEISGSEIEEPLSLLMVVMRPWLQQLTVVALGSAVSILVLNKQRVIVVIVMYGMATKRSGMYDWLADARSRGYPSAIVRQKSQPNRRIRSRFGSPRITVWKHFCCRDDSNDVAVFGTSWLTPKY